MERQRLLSRIREQEGVIRYLWDNYTHDVGREPELSALANPAPTGTYAVDAAALRRIVEKEKTFDDAINEFSFTWTHTFTEAYAQRATSQLLHGRRTGVVSRRTGDVAVRNYCGMGVSLTAFNRLLQKLRDVPAHGVRCLDLSNNGFTDDFVPGIVEILRRQGVRQLDVSQNSIDAPAMHELCDALPSSTPYLEVLDLRQNPCACDRGFILSLAVVLSKLQYLDRLGVSVRCGAAVHEAAAGPEEQDAERAEAWRHSAAVHTRPLAHHPGRTDSGPGEEFARSLPSVTSRHRAGSYAGPAVVRPATAAHSRPAWGSRPRTSSQDGSVSRCAARRTDQPGAARNRGPAVGRETQPYVDNSGRRHCFRRRPQSTGAVDASQLRGHHKEELESMRAKTDGDVAVTLFRAMSELQHLRVLDVSHSRFSARAMERLGHLVRDGRLASLALACCALGDAAEPLLEAVAVCRTLAHLDLQRNELRGHTGRRICTALAESVSLTEVDLSGNKLGDDFGRAFATVLASNEVLWKVSLTGNPLGEDTGDRLLDVFQRRNFTLIDIGDRDTGTEGCLFDLGLRNRLLIERCLKLNAADVAPERLTASEKKELEGLRGRRTDGLSLDDFDWKILDDEPFFEPMWVLFQ